MKRTPTARALVLATAVLTLLVSFAHAGPVVYRWNDAQGNQVNSDRPPPEGIEYEVISTSSSMVRPVDATGSDVKPQGKPGAAEGTQPAVATSAAIEKNPEYCARARDNLTQLDTHARIRLRNDQGEIRYLSEEEKIAERQKALDAIKAYCE